MVEEVSNDYWEAAPVLITVYNRFTHFIRTVEALKKCDLARKTTLFVASDAPFLPAHEQDVEKIRSYISSISGFTKVIPIFREKNLGARENLIQARKRIFDNYDYLIQMEDDVLVGKGFLQFVNDGLRLFKDHPNVAMVCAYLPPGIEAKTKKPLFLDMIAPYGMGRWKLKDEQIDKQLEPKILDNLFKNFDFFVRLEKKLPHIIRSIPMIIKGNMRFGDIERDMILQANNWKALYPPISLSRNIGFDGSGLHSGFRPEMQNQRITDQFFEIVLPMPIEVNIQLANDISRFRRKRFHKFTNYSLFYAHKYIPGYFFIYKLVRNFYKQIKK